MNEQISRNVQVTDIPGSNKNVGVCHLRPNHKGCRWYGYYQRRVRNNLSSSRSSPISVLPMLFQITPDPTPHRWRNIPPFSKANAARTTLSLAQRHIAKALCVRYGQQSGFFDQALRKGNRQNLIGNPRNCFTVVMAGAGPSSALRTEWIMRTPQLLDRACASPESPWEWAIAERFGN